jgi:hypothetical protein
LQSDAKALKGSVGTQSGTLRLGLSPEEWNALCEFDRVGSRRLGLGEFEHLGDDVDGARRIFLSAVEKLAPAVAADLRALWCKYGRPPASALEHWARVYGLLYKGSMPAWVAGVAVQTCETWTMLARYVPTIEAQRDGDPQAKPKIRFDLAGLVISGEMLSDDLEFRFAWNPRFETRADAKRRFDKLIDGVRSGADERDVRLFRSPEHFEWAVTFQVLGNDIPKMARASSDDYTFESRKHTIDTAVRDVLGLVGLDRRNRAGRPRKH